MGLWYEVGITAAAILDGSDMLVLDRIPRNHPQSSHMPVTGNTVEHVGRTFSTRCGRKASALRMPIYLSGHCLHPTMTGRNAQLSIDPAEHGSQLLGPTLTLGSRARVKRPPTSFT